MQYFPLFLKLTDQPVLVIGGGEVASRKVESLIRANARVTLVAPSLSPYLTEMAEQRKINWINSQYREELITDYIQVWATTNNSQLNHRVHKDAKKKGILVNVVDDTPYCDFITPSMVNRGSIQVAISSGGGSPVLVRRIREKIEKLLPQNTGLLSSFAQEKREHIKSVYKTVAERRMFWERFFAERQVELTDNKEELESVYQDLITRNDAVTLSREWVEFGSNPDLLSIRTLRIMQETEWVLYPENCPFGFIDLCRRDAERTGYKTIEELADLMQNPPEDAIKRICILIPRGAGTENSELQKLIGSDRILRIVD